MRLRRALQALVAGEFLLRLAYLVNQRMDFDEKQALHAAYSVASGLVPYKDFWENHTPLTYYVFAPLYYFDVPTQATIFIARGVVALLGLVALGLTYRLARRLLSVDDSWFAVALIGACGIYAWKSMEVRPDIFYLVFGLAGTDALVRAPTDPRGGWRAGLWLGLAACATPKAIFSAGALGIGVLVWAWRTRAWRVGLAQCVRFGLGFLAPLAVVTGLFAAQGALGAFWRWAVVFNFTVPRHSTFWPWQWLFHWNVLPLLLLGLAGLVEVARAERRGGADPRWLILAGSALVLVVNYVFIMPMPYSHSSLPLWPPLAVLGLRALPRLGASARPTAVALAVVLPFAFCIDDGALVFHRNWELDAQLAAGRRIREILAPGECYVSSDADAIARPSCWFFPVIVQELADAMARREYPPPDLPSFEQALTKSQTPLIVVVTYTPLPYTPEQAAWIERHYVSADDTAESPPELQSRPRYGRLFYVPGMAYRPTGDVKRIAFDVTVPGTYDLGIGGKADRVTIDGHPVSGKVELAAGKHQMGWSGNPTRLMLKYETLGVKRLLVATGQPAAP